MHNRTGRLNTSRWASPDCQIIMKAAVPTAKIRRCALKHWTSTLRTNITSWNYATTEQRRIFVLKKHIPAIHIQASTLEHQSKWVYSEERSPGRCSRWRSAQWTPSWSSVWTTRWPQNWRVVCINIFSSGNRSGAVRPGLQNHRAQRDLVLRPPVSGETRVLFL